MNVTMWYKVEQLTMSDDADRVRVRLREESDFSFQIINRREQHIGLSETWFEMEVCVDDNDLKLGDIIKIDATTVAYAPCDNPGLDLSKRKDNKCKYMPSLPKRGTPDDEEDEDE